MAVHRIRQVHASFRVAREILDSIAKHTPVPELLDVVPVRRERVDRDDVPCCVYRDRRDFLVKGETPPDEFDEDEFDEGFDEEFDDEEP